MSETNALILTIEQNQLEPETGITLKENFLPYFEQAEEWKSKAEALVITDVSQVREMKMAREARLALKEIRVNVEKKRKQLKEDSLRKGKAIDGIANVIKFLIEPIEEHLEQQEKFAEIQEAKRKEALKAARMESLAPYEVDCTFYDLANMPEESFANLLKASQLDYENKQAEIRRIEEERIAKEKAEAEERERIRVENERLKAEAAEREKVIAAERAAAEAEAKRIREEQEKILAAERAKAEEARKVAEEKALLERKAAEAEAQRIQAEQEAKLKAEQAEKARVMAELKAKQDAEELARKEAEAKAEAEKFAQMEAERKAKSAPDKDKLNHLAMELEVITISDLQSDEAKKIMAAAEGLLTKVANYIRENSAKL